MPLSVGLHDGDPYRKQGHEAGPQAESLNAYNDPPPFWYPGTLAVNCALSALSVTWRAFSYSMDCGVSNLISLFLSSYRTGFPPRKNRFGFWNVSLLPFVITTMMSVPQTSRHPIPGQPYLFYEH